MKKKLLPWIIALSALSVSGSAAFYSVSGLGKMFAGASLEVMVLAGSLEFAKLVTASLLYQYWKKLNLGLKLYLSISTLILIIITSAGIYGFLSSAYQETSFKVQNQDKNIEILDKNISIVKTEIKNFESQIKQKNDRLGQLTTIRTNLQSTQDVLIEKSKSTTAVRQQIKDIDSEIKRMDSEISILNDSISSKNTRISSIEQQKFGVSSNADLAKEVGPLKYIATLTGSSIDSVVNWYIIVLMLVFDPLAIALVIAANFAFEMNEDKNDNPDNKEKNNKEMKNKIISIFKKIIPSKKIKDVQQDESQEILENIQNSDAQIQYSDYNDETDEVEIFYEEGNELNVEEEILTEENQEVNNNGEEEILNEQEDNKQKEDKYNAYILLENQRISRDKFRNNEDSSESRDKFRNNPGDNINPLSLR